MKLTIGVIGVGAMGRGICQWAVELGARVLGYDFREGAAADARTFVAEMLSRSVAKGKLSAAEREAMLAHFVVTEFLSEFVSADVVIEAIVEDIDVKRKLFAELEDVVSDDTILCTNTSSLSVTGCASDCRFPERVAGLHFSTPRR